MSIMPDDLCTLPTSSCGDQSPQHHSDGDERMSLSDLAFAMEFENEPMFSPPVLLSLQMDTELAGTPRTPRMRRDWNQKGPTQCTSSSIHHFIAALQGIEDCGKQLSIVDAGLLAFDRADLNNSPVPSSCLHKGFMSTIVYYSGESEG